MINEDLKNIRVGGKNLEELHRMLWNYITEHGCSKSYWFKNIFSLMDGAEKISYKLQNLCFACYYNDRVLENIGIDDSNSCEACPLCTREEGSGCLNGMFAEYCDLNEECNIFEANRVAKEIANLPWKW